LEILGERRLDGLASSCARFLQSAILLRAPALADRRPVQAFGLDWL
jgi:hypothetical protein